MLTIEPVRMNKLNFVHPAKKLSMENVSFCANTTISQTNSPHLIQTHGFVVASDKTRLGANYNPETKTVDFKSSSAVACA